RNEPVPSDLYRFLDTATDPVVVKVNDTAVDATPTRGYVSLARTWRAGDTIDLSLPMPVRRIVASESVDADRGRVALQRGPIVYTADWVDTPEGRVRTLVLPDSSPLTAEFRADLLSGVEVIKGRATALAFDANGRVEKTEQAFTAIPYSKWANRGRGQM